MRPQPPRSPLFPYTTLFRNLALPALLYLHEKYASWESAMDVHDLPPAEGKFAGTVKVGEKGQIVIPKGARDLFGIKPGDTLLLLADAQQGMTIVRQDVFDKFIAEAMPHRPEGTPPANDETTEQGPNQGDDQQ